MGRAKLEKRSKGSRSNVEWVGPTDKGFSRDRMNGEWRGILWTLKNGEPSKLHDEVHFF